MVIIKIIQYSIYNDLSSLDTLMLGMYISIYSYRSVGKLKADNDLDVNRSWTMIGCVVLPS